MFGGSGGPRGSPALNVLGHRKGHGFLLGGRLNPAVGLRCPHFPELWCHAPGEGPSVADLRLGFGTRSPKVLG